MREWNVANLKDLLKVLDFHLGTERTSRDKSFSMAIGTFADTSIAVRAGS